MNRKGILIFIMLLVGSGFLWVSCEEDNPMEPGGIPEEPGKVYGLTVNYNYTGAVTIDASHKIMVGLFYSDFVSAAPDIGLEAYSASGSVTFNQVTGTPVRVGIVVDKNGDGSPSQDDPYELYNNQWQNGNAIDLESVNSISINFNDTYAWNTGGDITFFINGQATNFQKYSMAVWESGYPRTLVYGSGNLSDGIPCITMTFTNTTGTCDQANGAFIEYVDELGHTFASDYGGNCLITVTAYGAVGGLIEGTFSGTIVRTDYGATNIIAGGIFGLRRWSDQ